MRAIALAVSAATLMTFAACELLTGPGDRVIGIIGYETASEAEGGANRSSLSPDNVAFGRMATDTTPPWCPDHPHVYQPDCPLLEAPDTVDAGVVFQIIVRTSATAGCNAPDGAEVAAADTMVEVVPYDRKTGPGCWDAVGALPRSVELVFPDPGDVLIRVTGRVLIVGDSVVEERMGSVDHPVVVR